jgi:hypothetical protein
MVDFLQSLIVKNFWTKLTAAVLAVLFYFYVTDLIQKNRPFEFIVVQEGTAYKKNAILYPDLPDLIIVPEKRDRPLQIELTGTTQDIEQLRAQIIVGFIPASLFTGRLGEGVSSGQVSVSLGDVEFPDNLGDVTMILLDRPTIDFQVSRRRTEQMRVTVEVDDSRVPRDQYNVGVPRLDPTYVDVSGPESWFDVNSEISLAPIIVPATQTGDFTVTGKLPEELANLGIELAEPIDVEVPIDPASVERKFSLKVFFLFDGAVRLPEEFGGKELRDLFSLEGNDGYDKETNTLEVTLRGPAAELDRPRNREIFEREEILFLTIEAEDLEDLVVAERYLHTSDKLPPAIKLAAPEKVDVRRVENLPDSGERESP